MTKPGGGKDTESQGLHSVSEFVVSSSNSTPSRGHGALVMQQPRISRSHSSDHMSHSKITGSSLSPSTMASSYSHSSVPYSTRSVSSLGYVSDDPLSGNSLLMHSAPDLTHLYPPNSKNSSGTGTGSSGMEFPETGCTSRRNRFCSTEARVRVQIDRPHWVCWMVGGEGACPGGCRSPIRSCLCVRTARRQLHILTKRLSSGSSTSSSVACEVHVVSAANCLTN